MSEHKYRRQAEGYLTLGAKSKNKGKGFEREVAKYLSELYEESFIRVPQSGAYTGGKNAVRREVLSEGQTRAHKGDIIPPDGWQYFNCECKNYAGFTFHKLFQDQEIPLLESWITQVLDAGDPDDLNIIFMKFDRIGRYVAFQLPNEFLSERSVDYYAANQTVWRFMGFDEFFKLNKENLKKRSMTVFSG